MSPVSQAALPFMSSYQGRQVGKERGARGGGAKEAADPNIIFSSDLLKCKNKREKKMGEKSETFFLSFFSQLLRYFFLGKFTEVGASHQADI